MEILLIIIVCLFLFFGVSLLGWGHEGFGPCIRVCGTGHPPRSGLPDYRVPAPAHPFVLQYKQAHNKLFFSACGQSMNVDDRIGNNDYITNKLFNS